MKYAVLALFLVGCASPRATWVEGCHQGLYTYFEQQKLKPSSKGIEAACNSMYRSGR